MIFFITVYRKPTGTYHAIRPVSPQSGARVISANKGTQIFSVENEDLDTAERKAEEEAGKHGLGLKDIEGLSNTIF